MPLWHNIAHSYICVTTIITGPTVPMASLVIAQTALLQQNLQVVEQQTVSALCMNAHRKF